MKLNELIGKVNIFVSNEEKQLLNDFKGVMLPEQFTERQQGIIENLIRKSLISKVNHKGKLYLVKNDNNFK